MSTFTTTPSTSPIAASSMTRAQLRNAVRQNLGNRADKDALINDALNAALRNAAQRHRFRGLEQEHSLTLLQNTDSVVLPSLTAKVVDIRVVDGTHSYHMDLSEKTKVIRYVPDATSVPPARPFGVYEEGGRLIFVPVADKDYNLIVTMLEAPSQLNADTDKPNIVGIENAMIAYATAYAMRSLEKFTEAAQWEAQYEKELQSAIVNDLRRPAMRRYMSVHNTRYGLPSEQAFGSAFAGHRVRWR